MRKPTGNVGDYDYIYVAYRQNRPPTLGTGRHVPTGNFTHGKRTKRYIFETRWPTSEQRACTTTTCTLLRATRYVAAPRRPASLDVDHNHVRRVLRDEGVREPLDVTLDSVCSDEVRLRRKLPRDLSEELQRGCNRICSDRGSQLQRPVCT